MNISIVITTYNASAYIIATLNSIRLQTYSQFEVVIIDDGSTDGTVNVIRKYIEDENIYNITLVELTHVGRAPALNKGILTARFNWIAIIDADDLWHVKKLEIQIKMVKCYQLDFICTKSKLFYDNSAVDLHYPINLEEQNSLKKISMSKMLVTNQISHSSILIKKELLKYNNTRKSQIDYDMWLTLLEKGVAIYIISYPLTYHRIHENQSFESKHPMKYALNAAQLQLSYCFSNSKWLPALLVVSKVIYYSLLPRKLRLLLREVFF